MHDSVDRVQTFHKKFVGFSLKQSMILERKNVYLLERILSRENKITIYPYIMGISLALIQVYSGVILSRV